ncbi:MAG: SHOCT domain-containing protein [Desulfovibrionaceae bacterium]|nr:SHOCT domain-containing protein [Desulfovibrionaceae bacterium]
MFQCTVRVFCLALLLGTALQGCGGEPGVRATTTQSVNSTTKGQELLDLKQAYDQGIITEREYNRQKERILDRKY